MDYSARASPPCCRPNCQNSVSTSSTRSPIRPRRATFQHRARDQGEKPRSCHSVELLWRVRTARAHDATAAYQAKGRDIRGAERRGVKLSLRQGIPGSRAICHRQQPLVRPAQPDRARPQEGGRRHRQVLHLQCGVNYSAMLLLADAIERAGSADRLRIIDASLHRPSTSTSCPMPDEVRQRPTRRAGSTQVQDGDIQVILPGLRRREADLPDPGQSASSPDGASDAAGSTPPKAEAEYVRSRDRARRRDQRAAHRRGLRARVGRADARLRRPAHHQFRPRRHSDAGDVRCALRAPGGRRSAGRGFWPYAGVFCAGLCGAALS